MLDTLLQDAENSFLLAFLSSINNDTSKIISVVDKTGYIYEKLDSSNDIKYELIGRSSSLEEARSISESKSDYGLLYICLLYTSPSPRDKRQSRMPSSA